MDKFQALKINLIKSKKSQKEIFTDFKTEFSIQELLHASEDPLIKKRFIKFWPIESIGNLDDIPYEFSTYYVEDSKVEWKYILASCIVQKDVLQDFIKLKSSFEKHILFGEIGSAESVLEEVQNKLGESFWLINSIFLLEELKNGTEGNWNKLAEISRNKEDGVLRFILESFSKRNEANIALENYKKDTLDQITSLPLEDPLKDFLYFITSLWDKVNTRSSAFIMFFISRLPAVDRYIFIQSFLKFAYPRFTESDFKLFLYPLKTFYKAFPQNDIVKNILTIERQRELVASDFNWALAKFSDLILSKDMDSAIKVLKDNFLETSSLKCLFDLNVYYAKTNEILKEWGLRDESLLFKINKLIEKIVKKDIALHENLLDALKLYSQIEYFENSLYLLHIVQREIMINSVYPFTNIISIIGEKFISIESIFFQTEKPMIHITQFVDSELRKFKNFNIFLKNKDDHKNLKSLDSEIPDVAFLIARDKLKGSDQSEGINEFKIIIDTGIPYYKDLAIFQLVDYYASNKRYVDLIELVGFYTIFEPQYLYRLKVRAICEIMDEIGFVGIDNLIYTPVLMYKGEVANHDVYLALETFLGNNGFDKPSDSFENEELTKNRAYNYLLLNVCSIDVIKYFTVFENMKEVEAERIKILKYLSDKGEKENQKVVTELVELSQRDVIRKGITNYNKGKISLNLFHLRRYLMERMLPTFQRFKLQNEFAQDSDYQSVDYDNVGDYRVIVDLQSLGQINTLVSLKDPSFISFKLIFNEIRDIFLFSKEYGIDGLLSTRIRHGVLVNQIKKVFFSLHLLAIKDSGVYQEVRIWNELYSDLGEHVTSEIQNAIFGFSQGIEDYCNKLRLEYVQIKTEKTLDKNFALFDFSIKENDYLGFFAVAREHNVQLIEFIDFITNVLASTTLKQLDSIRRFLSEFVNLELRSKVEELKHKIQNILSDYSAPDLYTNITQSLTSITQELNMIANWFQLVEEDSAFELTQKEVIQVAVKVSNVLYPNYQLNPTIIENNPISVIYSLGLVDILKILLENVIIHSGCSPESVDLTIIATFGSESKMLCIECGHALNESINLNTLQLTLNRYVDGWDNRDFYGDKISSEGGSGLKKIKRLLEYDLQIKNSKFNFELDNSRLKILLAFQIEIITMN